MKLNNVTALHSGCLLSILKLINITKNYYNFILLSLDDRNFF